MVVRYRCGTEPPSLYSCWESAAFELGGFAPVLVEGCSDAWRWHYRGSATPDYAVDQYFDSEPFSSCM